MKRNKRMLSLLLLLGLVVLSIAGCNNAASDQPGDLQDPTTQQPQDPQDPADTPDPALPPDEDQPPSTDQNWPEESLLMVNKDGQEQEITAYRTTTAAGLLLYLLPDFMLTSDGGYDVLLPQAESGYPPASLTIYSYEDALTAEEALAKAQENYPGVEFAEALPMVDLPHMQEGFVAHGTLDGDWVMCLGMSGANGSVSVWGQGPSEGGEEVRGLLANQVATLIKP